MEFTPFILAFIGAAACATVAWSLLDVHQRFIRSGGAHTGGRPPLLFRIMMPYIKAFSRMFSGLLRTRRVVTEGGGEWSSIHQAESRRETRSFALRWLYDKTRDALLAAGSPHGMDVADYWGFAACLWIFFGLFELAILAMTGYPLLCLLVLPVGFLPFVYLSDVARYRRRRVNKDLPFALDLLTLSVEAGMDFTAALAQIAERLGDSPLSQEFDLAGKEINMGRQRADSLRDMAGRLQMAEVRSVVSSLVQADKLGTGLGRVLRIQSEDVRLKRFQNAEKRASEVPTKMLFPLVVFIFPVTLLMVTAPLIVRLIEFYLAGG
jgi:tight adherence protein C